MGRSIRFEAEVAAGGWCVRYPWFQVCPPGCGHGAARNRRGKERRGTGHAGPGSEPGGPRPDEPAENGDFRVRNEAPQGQGDDPTSVRRSDEARPSGPPVPTRRPTRRSGASDDPQPSANAAIAPPDAKGATMNDERGSTTSGTEVLEPTEPTTGSEGGGSAPPGSGARRRRRRGGRGRGGRGGSGSGAGTADGVRPPEGTPAGEQSSSTATEQPEIDLDAQPGEVERSPATAPTGGTTRKRSRGGRGRGRSGGATSSTARPNETDVAPSDGPVAEPATETADGGVDGAAEAEVTQRTTTRRRRSRGGRGRGRAKPAGDGSEAGEAGEAGAEADGQEPARQRSTRAASGRTTTRRKTEPSKKKPTNRGGPSPIPRSRRRRPPSPRSRTRPRPPRRPGSGGSGRAARPCVAGASRCRSCPASPTS